MQILTTDTLRTADTLRNEAVRAVETVRTASADSVREGVGDSLNALREAAQSAANAAHTSVADSGFVGNGVPAYDGAFLTDSIPTADSLAHDTLPAFDLLRESLANDSLRASLRAWNELRDDTLLWSEWAREGGVRLHGWFSAWTAAADDAMMGTLLLALVLLLTTLAASRRNIRLQRDSVFAPAGSRQCGDCARMQATVSARLGACALTLVTSLSVASCAIYIATLLCGEMSGGGDATEALPSVLLSPMMEILPVDIYLRFVVACSLGAGVAGWALFFAVKRCLVGYVNWTFFHHEPVRQWQCVFRLSMAVKAVAWTGAALLMTCNELCFTNSVLLCIFAFIPGLLVTMWGTWRLFFGKALGSFHYLLYLCTLELMLPLLAVLFHAYSILPQ